MIPKRLSNNLWSVIVIMANFEVLNFLKVLDSKQITQFLHDCVDDLIGKRNLNYKWDNTQWTKENYDKLVKCIQNIYRDGIITNNINLQLEPMEENLQVPIQMCFYIRKRDIFQALLYDSVLKRGHNLVENIDWKLKWILGSSDLFSYKEPLLQVFLHCTKKKNEANIKNTVYFEVDLDQVDSLIKSLKEIKQDLE